MRNSPPEGKTRVNVFVDKADYLEYKKILAESGTNTTFDIARYVHEVATGKADTATSRIERFRSK